MRRAVPAALVVFLTLYAFPYFAELRTPHELLHVWAARALVDDGTYALDAQLRRNGTLIDLARHDGRLYSNKAPLLAFIDAAVYAAVRGADPTLRALVWLLRVVTAAIPFLLGVWCMARLLRDVAGVSDGPLRRALTVAYALGTPAFTYALVHYTHGPANALLVAAFTLLATAPRRPFAAGLCAGLAVAAEYPSALVVVPLAAYAMYTTRSPGPRLAFFAGGAPVALLLAVFHAACFGGPFQTPYHHLVTDVHARALAQGFLGVTWPHPDRVLGTLFSLHRGLLTLAPWLALCLPGFVSWWRTGARRAECLFAAGTSVLLVLFNGSYHYWEGAWSLGPRHILPAAPLMALGAGHFIAHTTRTGRLWAAALLAASLVLVVPASLLFAQVPPAYRNPFHDMVLPLLVSGHFPYSAANFFGVTGLASAVPALLALACALLWCTRIIAGSTPRAVRATVLGLALVAAAAPLQREPTWARWRQDLLLRRMWEPPGHSTADARARRLRGVALPSPDDALALGHLEARRDHPDAALRYYARALDAE
jgi:hypothetical protein